MVAGYHLIWTVYGYWLPNDIRGSTSTEVRVASIKDLAALHYGRKPAQPSSKELRTFLGRAHDELKHSVHTLSQDDIAVVGKAFATLVAERRYLCYACAIMPDHVHILVRRNPDRAEEMIKQFQDASRQALIHTGDWGATHPVWTQGGWKGFMNSQKDFQRTIEYIRANPKEIKLPEQLWDFVVPYDGWLP